jgi:hypothetical protein
MAGELHQLLGAAVSCGGFIAVGVISVGALFGVSRLIESLTRIERPKMVPIEQIFGDVAHIHADMSARTAITSPGEGAVEAARAGEIAPHGKGL